MHVRDLFETYPALFSFEFFPPKTAETAEGLYQSIGELEGLKPQFVSITYGAGGSTRDLTHDLVLRLKQRGVLDPFPHLTCVGHTEGEIRTILERYAAAGISNIIALGGDPDAVRRVGIHWATEQCRDLLDHNVRGIHFYTLNRSTATREVFLNLGVKDSGQLMPARKARH